MADPASAVSPHHEDVGLPLARLLDDYVCDSCAGRCSQNRLDSDVLFIDQVFACFERILALALHALHLVLNNRDWVQALHQRGSVYYM